MTNLKNTLAIGTGAGFPIELTTPLDENGNPIMVDEISYDTEFIKLNEYNFGDLLANVTPVFFDYVEGVGYVLLAYSNSNNNTRYLYRTQGVGSAFQLMETYTGGWNFKECVKLSDKHVLFTTQVGINHYVYEILDDGSLQRLTSVRTSPQNTNTTSAVNGIVKVGNKLIWGHQVSTNQASNLRYIDYLPDSTSAYPFAQSSGVSITLDGGEMLIPIYSMVRDDENHNIVVGLTSGGLLVSRDDGENFVRYTVTGQSFTIDGLYINGDRIYLNNASTTLSTLYYINRSLQENSSGTIVINNAGNLFGRPHPRVIQDTDGGLTLTYRNNTNSLATISTYVYPGNIEDGGSTPNTIQLSANGYVVNAVIQNGFCTIMLNNGYALTSPSNNLLNWSEYQLRQWTATYGFRASATNGNTTVYIGDNGNILSTDNGVVYTITGPSDGTLYSVSWDGEKFIAVGVYDTWISYTGHSWEIFRGLGGPRLNTSQVAPVKIFDGVRYIAIDAQRSIMVSNDEKVWEGPRDFTFGEGNITGGLHLAGNYILTCTNGREIFISSDHGDTWVEITNPIDTSYMKVIKYDEVTNHVYLYVWENIRSGILSINLNTNTAGILRHLYNPQTIYGQTYHEATDKIIAIDRNGGIWRFNYDNPYDSPEFIIPDPELYDPRDGVFRWAIIKQNKTTGTIFFILKTDGSENITSNSTRGYRSTDGGLTWTRIVSPFSGLTNLITSNNVSYQYPQLEVNEALGQWMLFGSIVNGASTVVDRFNHWTSADDGVTWTVNSGSLGANAYFCGIYFNPSDGYWYLTTSNSGRSISNTSNFYWTVWRKNTLTGTFTSYAVVPGGTGTQYMYCPRLKYHPTKNYWVVYDVSIGSSTSYSKVIRVDDLTDFTNFKYILGYNDQYYLHVGTSQGEIILVDDVWYFCSQGSNDSRAGYVDDDFESQTIKAINVNTNSSVPSSTDILPFGITGVGSSAERYIHTPLEGKNGEIIWVTQGLRLHRANNKAITLSEYLPIHQCSTVTFVEVDENYAYISTTVTVERITLSEIENIDNGSYLTPTFIDTLSTRIFSDLQTEVMISGYTRLQSLSRLESGHLIVIGMTYTTIKVANYGNDDFSKPHFSESNLVLPTSSAITFVTLKNLFEWNNRLCMTYYNILYTSIDEGLTWVQIVDTTRANLSYGVSPVITSNNLLTITTEYYSNTVYGGSDDGFIRAYNQSFQVSRIEDLLTSYCMDVISYDGKDLYLFSARPTVLLLMDGYSVESEYELIPVTDAIGIDMSLVNTNLEQKTYRLGKDEEYVYLDSVTGVWRTSDLHNYEKIYNQSTPYYNMFVDERVIALHNNRSYNLAGSPPVTNQVTGVLISKDHGENWIQATGLDNQYINDIIRDFNGDLVAVGNGGYLGKSTDNGSTWTTMQSDTTVDLITVDTVSGNTYILGGLEGLLMSKTYNRVIVITPVEARTWLPLEGDIDLIRQSIQAILIHNIGQRFRLEHFGTRIAETLEEPNSAATEYLLKTYIRQGIVAWEPRVQKVTVSTTYQSASSIKIQVRFQINYSQNVNELNFDYNPQTNTINAN